MMGADPGASAFPNDDNLFEWTATLSGSEDTAVRGRRRRKREGREIRLAFSGSLPIYDATGCMCANFNFAKEKQSTAEEARCFGRLPVAGCVPFQAC